MSTHSMSDESYVFNGNPILVNGNYGTYGSVCDELNDFLILDNRVAQKIDEFNEHEFNELVNNRVASEIGVTEKIDENDKLVNSDVTSEIRVNLPPPVENKPKSPTSSERADYCLKEFVSQATGGNVILLAYEKTEFLAPGLRESLVHIIIQKEVDYDINNLIDPGSKKLLDFNVLDKDNTMKRIPADGKLLERFRYMRKILIASELLQPAKQSIKKTLEPVESSAAASQSAAVENITSQMVEDNNWLKEGHIEPEDEVLKKWKSSYVLRRKLLLEDRIDFIKYIEIYPCFENFATKLINYDFDILKPHHDEIFQTNWPKLRSKLLVKAIKKDSSKDSENCFEEGPDKKDRVILLNFSKFIVFPGLKRKQDKGAKKPSTSEVQQTFVISVENPGDVDSEIKKQTDACAEQNEKLQPFMLFTPDAYYVVIDQKKFQLNSPLEALDFTFKAFYVFNLEYPWASYHIWQIIQEVAYGIKTEKAAKQPGTKALTLIAELKMLLK